MTICSLKTRILTITSILFVICKQSTQQQPVRNKPSVLFYYPAPFSNFRRLDHDEGLTIVFEIVGLENLFGISALMLLDDTPIPISLSDSIMSVDVSDLSNGEHEVSVHLLDGHGSQVAGVEAAVLQFSVDGGQSRAFSKESEAEMYAGISLEAGLRHSRAQMLPNSYYPNALRPRQRGNSEGGILDSSPGIGLDEQRALVDTFLSMSLQTNGSAVMEMVDRAGSKGDLNALYFRAMLNAGPACPGNISVFRECADAGHALCQMALGFRHWYGHGTDESCGKALGYYRQAARTALSLLYPIAGAVPHSTSRIMEESEVCRTHRSCTSCASKHPWCSASAALLPLIRLIGPKDAPSVHRHLISSAASPHHKPHWHRHAPC
jgi:hypothetical protein